MPNFPTKGLYDRVPSDVIQEEIDRMTRKAGMEGIVGDIHSHPTPPRDEMESISQIFFPDQPAFSVGDLYRLVHAYPKISLMGVVDGSDNLFAFKSKDTIPTIFMDQESFQKFWYENNGWEYKGDCKAIRKSSSAPSPADIANQIIKQHKLVLYKGRSRKNLTRVAV